MANFVFNFRSRVLGKQTQISVILPEGCDVPEYGWKTITLLHGWSENHMAWMSNTSIERYAQKRQLAVIMPDCEFSFYNDMADGLNYLTYLTEELPAVCNKYFRTSLRREDNSIGGLSMGGCGALTVGLTRPDLYQGIIILSAANFPADAFPEQYENQPWPTWLPAMRRIYGDIFPNLKGTKYDAYTLAEDILKEGKPCPVIWHYMGSDELAGMRWSETMGKVFLGYEGNPFNYKFVTYPGIHNWDSWDNVICEGMDYIGLTEVK